MGEKQEFKAGDKVRVAVRGKFIGLTGRVDHLSGDDRAFVEFDHRVWFRFGGDIHVATDFAWVPIRHLRTVD